MWKYIFDDWHIPCLVIILIKVRYFFYGSKKTKFNWSNNWEDAVKLYDKVQQLDIINRENGQSEEITSDLLIEAADSTEIILLRDKINNI